MDEIKYIDDPRGGRVPLTDAHGNLTVEAMVLYNQDLLSTEGKAMMDEILASDEMARDALEGYALMANAKEAKVAVASINRSLGTEKETVVAPVIKLDYKKFSAAAAIVILIGIGGVVGVKFIGQNQLADSEVHTKTEKTNDRLKSTQPSYETETIELEHEIKELGDSNNLNVITNHQSELHGIPDAATVDKAKQPIETEQKPEVDDNSSAILLEARTEKNENEDFDKRDELLNKLASPMEQKDDIKQVSAADNEDESLEKFAGNTSITEDDLAAAPTPEPASINEEIAYSEERQASTQMINEPLAAENEKSAVMAKQKTATAMAELDYQDQKLNSETPSQTVHSIDEVDQIPRFPGGDLELFKFIENHKIHPVNLKAQGIEGEVFVSFQLDANGNVSSVKPLRSDNSQMESDAIRVVRSMPKWQAAKKEGYPVTVKKTILIKYRIKD
ncbi:MAG: protein TonB [Granulosicoccus sp.]|jgi:protein TonB